MRPGLRDAVIERDARYLWGIARSPLRFEIWARHQGVICVVPALEPENRRPCAGKQEVDHVKDLARLSKKAPDDPYHLVAMCQAHNTWYPPSRALRQAERAYLAKWRALDEGVFV